ncbi:metallophosphoesterase [Paraclostridium ghonii]|uniref:metallophosphoesterase n=1 Tax=Paraclostridium ghonii TaxID=29358 RepID=UPI00202CD90B|nr:metallophosphoesterase [Paeniclostridium ghonii]MCM0166889.1 metallophosphoesterase [Paeniclostridium ghonii]
MKKKLFGVVLVTSMLLISGCTSTKSVDVNILATTDLHGVLTNELSEYVVNEKKKDKNITLVDAGDFYDSEFGTSGDMLKFFDQRRESFQNNKAQNGDIHIAKEMKDIGYETVTLGNHEFIGDKQELDNIISSFKKQKIDVLSANTYKKNGESYTKPYVIKKIETPQGTVKVGILGLTIKEVGESKKWDGEKLVKVDSLELKDQEGFKGELYMNDLVEDAKKWVKVMKEKDKADVIVAVAHTGEKPKKPRNPGNRIQDLATQVDGIDAIVAGHNHDQIKQHDYKNKSGKDVIVTEPGKHGECISKINLKLEKNNDKWEVINKSSDIVQFEKSKKALSQMSDNLSEFISSCPREDKLGEKISFGKIMKFKWDKLYVFSPKTSRDKIYDTVGYKFLNIAESNNPQLVFMNGNEVALCLSGNNGWEPWSFDFKESDFKDEVLTIAPDKNDCFIMEKGKDNPNTNTSGIKFVYTSN